MGCSALLTFLLLVLINSFIFLDNVEVAFLMTVKKEDILTFYKVRVIFNLLLFEAFYSKKSSSRPPLNLIY